MVKRQMLSSLDLSELCEGSSEATLTFAAAAQAAAKMLAQGWARGSTLRAETAVITSAVEAPNAPLAVPAPLPINAPHPSTPSRRRIEPFVIAIIRRVLSGSLPDAPVGVQDIFNAITREAQIAKAVRGAEEAFKTSAHDSSKARTLSASSSSADWSLHRATYIGSCTAA